MKSCATGLMVRLFNVTLFILDGRQPALPWYTNGDQVATKRVAGQEFFQGFADQLIWVGIRLTKDFGMLHVIEGSCGHLAFVNLKPDGFQCALPDIDPPNARLLFSH